MKKLLTICAFLAALSFSASKAMAQDAADTSKTAAQTPAADTQSTVTDATADAAAAGDEQSFHQALKEQFIAGGPPFMWPILITFIIGLAIAIERIITLNLATTNTKKLL